MLRFDVGVIPMTVSPVGLEIDFRVPFKLYLDFVEPGKFPPPILDLVFEIAYFD